jgi:hypothetical protein
VLATCTRGTRHRARRPRIERQLGDSGFARQDLVGTLGPHERLWIGLMGFDEGLDRRFELGHAAEGPAPDLFHRQLGEPAFHQVEPRAVGRREMHMKARAFGEPVSDQRRFVRAVIVHDDVHVESTRDARVDQIEKLAKLRGSMALMKLSDHVARLGVERGEQGRRAVPVVVMRPALDLSRLHRQERLRAIEGLNLRLLIDTEHRRVRRGIQVQADNIPDLFDEQRISGQFEGLAPMRLQPKRVPHAADGGVTETDGFRHLARTPVRGAARRRFQCTNNHVFHLRIRDRALGAGTRLIVQPIQSVHDESPAPFADRTGRDMQPPRDHLAVGPVSAGQNNARPTRQCGGRARTVRQRLQALPFVRRQDQRNLWASLSHARLLVRVYEHAAPFVSSSTVT